MTKEAKKEQEYILRKGALHHGFKDGERHTYSGDEEGNNRVVLKPHQFAAFKDKFDSVETLQEREKLQKEANKAKADLDKAREELAKKGINLDDLLAGNETIKKPDPVPGVGTNEPAPDDVTPPPTGSTSDPVAKNEENKKEEASKPAAAAKK